MGILGAGISINGPSGIDTASLVEQLTALEQQKVTDVQTKVTAYKTQISAYGKLQTAISTIQTAAKALNTSSSFDLFKSNSTDSDIVTLTGGAGALEGNYDIQVAQLAGSEKMISQNGKIASQTASLSSQGIAVGNISIDGTAITVDANDTIQDLRMKINSATDTNGKKLNVSASVLQAGTNNFRLVLTSKTTGSTGISYRDVSGSTLQNLGIIGGVTGAATQVVASQNPLSSAFDALKAGATIQYSGTNHSGAAINGTFTKIASNTSIDDFVSQLHSAFGGAAVSINGSGNLVIADSVTGASGLGLSSVIMTDSPAMTIAPNVFTTSTAGDAVTAQVIASQNPVATDFDNLKVGSTIHYTGLDHDGNTVDNTYTKATAATSINDFLTQIQTDFGGVASTDAGGNLVITDSQTGSSLLAVTDFTVTDTAAQAPATYLGAVTTAGSDGQVDKGNTTQTFTSVDNISTAFTGLALNSTITYTGLDHNGNAITDSFTKTAGTTINDFLAQMQQTFAGTIDVSLNAGNLVIADKTAGSSKLTLTTLSSTDATTHAVTSYAMNAMVTGKAGAGVMSVGKDAFYVLDGLTMTSSDNSVENVIGGSTIELHKASAGETIQTTLTRDTDAIKAKLQKLLDAYNALQTFVADETKMADPNDSNSTAGELAGDSTVKSIQSRIRQQFMQPSVYPGESYNSLTMIGVKTDPSTGQMSIDDTQFAKAITDHFDEVEHFFVTSGTGDNSNILLGRKTSDTQSGIYNLRETDSAGVDSADYLSIQLAGNAANPWYTSDIRNGDIVTFSDGPAKGLSLTSAAGIIGSGTTSSFTFSLGLGDGVSDLIKSLTDPGTGIIVEHENSINDQIKDANSRASDLQTRVNDYHDRLVKQFAAMEQAMETMKSQEQNMLSALGSTSTSS